MGLSASQARLLSITQRLSNNELESEFIANAKMQLATRNTLATEKYINALDSTKMEYISYDDTGIQETVALTFNSLNGYTALKNQYGVYNAQGQIYVSRKDAKNFAESSDLSTFLDKAGLFDQSKIENKAAADAYDAAMTQYEIDNNKYKAENTVYESELAKYNEELDKYNESMKNYEADLAKYNEELEAYNKDKYVRDQLVAAGITDPPYETFTGIVGNSSNPSSCYKDALDNAFDLCYLHVLGHLLNPETTAKSFTTTTGDVVSLSNADVATSAIGGSAEILKSTRSAILLQDPTTGEYVIKCDGDDDLSTSGKQNSLQTIIDAGDTPSKLQQLLSDYVYDASTNTATEVKSLAQKAIDVAYLIKEIIATYPGPVSRGPTDQTSITLFGETLTKDQMKNLLINFTDGDMKNVRTPEHPPTLTKPTPPTPLTVTKPVPPTPPKVPENFLKIYDKPLAQWYINLWYAMEGMSEAQQLDTVCDENANFSHYSIVDVPRSSSFVDGHQVNNYYTIIDDELASDSQWLEFAINNGLVTLRQIALRTNGDLTWEGTEFSSTSDMYEIEDTSAIAKAEAEYQKTLYQIQSEDKELDAEIKKLDTEHSALQTEVESIKNVMTKNVEKSFSVFS